MESSDFELDPNVLNAEGSVPLNPRRVLASTRAVAGRAVVRGGTSRPLSEVVQLTSKDIAELDTDLGSIHRAEQIGWITGSQTIIG